MVTARAAEGKESRRRAGARRGSRYGLVTCNRMKTPAEETTGALTCASNRVAVLTSMVVPFVVHAEGAKSSVSSNWKVTSVASGFFGEVRGREPLLMPPATGACVGGGGFRPQAEV